MGAGDRTSLITRPAAAAVWLPFVPGSTLTATTKCALRGLLHRVTARNREQRGIRLGLRKRRNGGGVGAVERIHVAAAQLDLQVGRKPLFVRRDDRRRVTHLPRGNGAGYALAGRDHTIDRLGTEIGGNDILVFMPALGSARLSVCAEAFRPGPRCPMPACPCPAGGCGSAYAPLQSSGQVRNCVTVRATGSIMTIIVLWVLASPLRAGMVTSSRVRPSESRSTVRVLLRVRTVPSCSFSVELLVKVAVYGALVTGWRMPNPPWSPPKAHRSGAARSTWTTLGERGNRGEQNG